MCRLKLFSLPKQTFADCAWVLALGKWGIHNRTGYPPLGLEEGEAHE